MITYTATLGDGTDELEPLMLPGHKALPLFHPEFFHYTDNPNSYVPGWIRMPCDPTVSGAGRTRSRWFKMHPHVLFPDERNTLWIDASFDLHVHPNEIAKFMDGADLLAFRHPDRTTIQQEAVEIARLHGVPTEKMNAQIDFYVSDGFRDQKMITSTGFCMRRHSPAMVEFCDLWWSELVRWGHPRDQMSVDYCAWKTGIKIAYLPGHHYRDNPWATYKKRRAPHA